MLILAKLSAKKLLTFKLNLISRKIWGVENSQVSTLCCVKVRNRSGKCILPENSFTKDDLSLQNITFLHIFVKSRSIFGKKSIALKVKWALRYWQFSNLVLKTLLLLLILSKNALMYLETYSLLHHQSPSSQWENQWCQLNKFAKFFQKSP